MFARAAGLLSLVALLGAQEPPAPGREHPSPALAEDPLHHLVEQEVPADGRAIEWESDFAGTLHVWARSASVDPALTVQVEDGRTYRDDDSGGGTVACLQLEVSVGAVLTITTLTDRAGLVELHWIACPETEETRRVADAVARLLDRIKAAEGAGDRSSAREILREAEELFYEVERVELGQALPDMAWDLGFAAHRSGSLEQCARFLRTVLAARERTLPEDHPDRLRALQNLCNTIHQLGDLAGARALGEELVAARERTLPDGNPGLLAARLNLAGTLMAQGNLHAARALTEAVLDEFKSTLPEDHPYLLAAREALVLTLHEQGELEEARALAEAVLAARERTLPSDSPDVVSARAALVLTLKAQGELSGAREIEQEMVEQQENTPIAADHPVLLRARMNLAATMKAQGEFLEAEELLDAVLEGFERTRPADHPDLLDTRMNLAMTRYLLGDFEGACEQAMLLAGGALVGLQNARTALSRREAGAIVESSSRWLSLVRFLCAPGDGTSGGGGTIVFDLAETLRSVASLELFAAVHSTPEIELLRQDLRDLRGEIGDLAAAPVTRGSPAEWTARMHSLSERRDAIERRLRRALVERGVSTDAIRAGEVARALPEGAAAIGYFRTQGFRLDQEREQITSRGDVLVAHRLDRSGEVREVGLGAAPELEGLARSWREKIGEPIGRGVGPGVTPTSDERAVGERLRERLLDPVLAGLGEDVTTLYVCVADLVHAVPLEALPLEDGCLGDRFRIVYMVSFGSLRDERERQDTGEPADLLVIGDVDFDSRAEAKPVHAFSASIEGALRSGAAGRLGRLPETRLELKALRQTFQRAFGGDGSELSGPDATKAAFHRLAPGKRFVHVATHAWFAEVQFPDPVDDERPVDGWSTGDRARAFTPWCYCGLAFAGANRGRDSLGRVPGIMTAEELAGIDLSACELAVLSACETNVGIRSAGLGIESLQAALHAAGARTAITSLWKVDDETTRTMMESFYRHLWIDGLSRADALWKAKCELRDAGSPVRHWAAWVLSGDPG